MDRERRRRWPQSRGLGCLLWLLILVILVVILSLLFGGFQKGTKAAPAGVARVMVAPTMTL